MYIWLKKDSEKRIELLKKEGRLGDVRVETCRSTGEQYIPTYANVFDPTASIPDIPADIVTRVTVKEYIYRGFRTNGIYRNEGAELMVKTHVQVHSTMMSHSVERETFQEINVSGPTVEAVKAIYSLVRQGELQPAEDWELQPKIQKVEAVELPSKAE